MQESLRVLFALALLVTAPLAVAEEKEVYAEGWYGFKNSSPQERDSELIEACAHEQGRFATIRRVFVPPEKGNTFDALCESVGLKCLTVCGWDGSPHPCNEEPPTKKGDGNLVARCVPALTL